MAFGIWFDCERAVVPECFTADKGKGGFNRVLWHEEKFGLCSVPICRSLGLGHFR